MRKVIIHIESIKKRNQKRHFQIKIPSTTEKVTGVLVTVNPGSMGKITDGIERGWLWLRIPEKRDVFFATTVHFEDHEQKELVKVDQPGISGNDERWFSAEKRDFFKVWVPTQDTIIEGFYVDRSKEQVVNYELRIYLETEDKNE